MHQTNCIYINNVLIDFDRNVAHGPEGEQRVEPKLALLLSVLARQSGDVVSRDELIDEVWDGAYGADQSLTNAVSQLRKILGDTEDETSAIETVPKRGYRLVSAVRMIPDGESIEIDNGPVPHASENAPAENIAGQEGAAMSERLLKFVPLLGLCALLIIVLSAILVPEHNPSDGTSEQTVDLLTPGLFATIDQASIAVLPFSNFSENEDESYFSDGISDEILNALVRVDGLRVASRTSAFTFRNSETLRVPEIAQILNVRHIIEGSVRKSGDRIRVTVQLIDASSDTHIWSETFERDLTAENLFAIQDEIATSIIQELNLLPVEDASRNKPWVSAKTDSISAYSEYLKGRENFALARSIEATRDGISHYERAVEIDPDFALAWAHLAGAYQIAPSWVLLDRDYFSLAKDAAIKAITLDPSLALPHGVLGLGEIESNPADYESAFRHFDEALQLEPNHTSILIWRGIAHIATGFFEAGMADFDTCLVVDADNGACRNWLAIGHLISGNEDEAFALFEVGAMKGNRTHIGIFAKAYAARGDKKLATLTWAWDFDGRSLDVERLYRAHTEPEFDYDLEASLFEIEYRADTGNVPNWGKVGGIDAAHTFKKYDTLEPYWWYPMWWLRMHEDFLESPHRARLIREHGVLDYWQVSGFPPQCRAVGETDFACD